MNRKFVNPYNFIPFEKEGPTEKSREEQYRGEESLLSGWLDVALYLKTPVIIPDGAYPTYIDPKTGRVIKNPTSDQKSKLHTKYAFLKYGDSYVIPGSEIRGMLRSVYEAVTNSCVHGLMDAKPISQRVPTDSAVNRRGLLSYKDGKWVLYATKKDPVKKFEPRDRDEARTLKSEIINWKDKPGTRFDDGSYLQYNIPVALNPPSDRMPNGQPYTIFKLYPTEVIKEWDDETPYKELKSALERDGANKNQANGNQRCMAALLSILNSAKSDSQNMVPVYYFMVSRGGEKLVYLSGSSIGRIGHHRKWSDVLEGHTPCKGPNYCPACLLFGSINTEGLKGHVRITDAYNSNANMKAQYHTLGILGAPRASAFEFYFRKPDGSAKFWNQDFWSKKNHEGYIEFNDLESATPRGRKMYWHGKLTDDAEMSNMNSTMESLSTDTPFKFKIFFDQITERQLKDLEWVVTLGENRLDGNLQHKIGHAKPLGYGSVKVVVEKENIRELYTVSDKIAYSVKSNSAESEIVPGTINVETISVKSVMKMTDVRSTAGKFVAYPHDLDRNGNATIFNWFSSNRKNLNNARVLPEPTDTNIELGGKWPDGAPMSVSPRVSKQPSESRVSSAGSKNGKIKRYMDDKGFGFILGDDGKDYFFHVNDYNGDTTALRPNVPVSFTGEKGKKGPVAKNVTVIS